jgi:hypothetical protein
MKVPATACLMKKTIFWDVTPCGSFENKEPNGVTFQKMVFFIVTAVKSPILRMFDGYLYLKCAVFWDMMPCGSSKN